MQTDGKPMDPELNSVLGETLHQILSATSSTNLRTSSTYTQQRTGSKQRYYPQPTTTTKAACSGATGNSQQTVAYPGTFLFRLFRTIGKGIVGSHFDPTFPFALKALNSQE